jgi:hypothetical protein
MGGVGSACERLRGKAGASCSSVCESIVDLKPGASCSSVCESIVDLKPGASCSSVCEVGAEERLDRSLAHRCPLLASPLWAPPRGVNIQKILGLLRSPNRSPIHVPMLLSPTTISVHVSD